MFLCTTQRIFQKCRDHRILFIQCHLIALRCQKKCIFTHTGSRINCLTTGFLRLGRTNQHFMLQSAIRDTVEHIFEISLISQSETCQRHSLRTEKNRQIFSLFFCNAIACTSGKGFRHISLSALSKTDCDFIIHFPILSFMTLFHKLFHSTILQKKLQFISKKDVRRRTKIRCGHPMSDP